MKAGFAWHYKRYSSDPLLSQAQVDARNAKAGLWADPHAIAPWDFRHPPSGTQRLAAAAISIPIFPTDDDRGIDGLLDGNFLCCQLDVGQATVTLTGSAKEQYDQWRKLLHERYASETGSGS